ncbi:hypothetical protein [Paenibacillus lautus]|uniref:hypothetical protein n=1 Tax=Paenibacillus lautus TaxID=1401 RepID=UPI003D28C187
MTVAVELDEMMEFAGELRGELFRIRRNLHQQPELLYDVSRTSKLVADLLRRQAILECISMEPRGITVLPIWRLTPSRWQPVL